MAVKDFSTIEQQITILKSRGLSIPNEEEAKEFLIRNNYYRVSGYSLTLRSHNKFFPSTNFQNIIDIYEFDHNMRHILLNYINKIEVTFKSIYSYEFTKVYGPLGYRTSAYFSNDTEYERIIAKAEDQKERRHAYEAYLKHFLDDLDQDIPLWAYIELLTISDISCLYSISERNIKIAVANAMGLNFNRGPELLGKFMHSMTIIRNLCAHGSRLYNRLFERKPSLNKKDFLLLREMSDGTKDNSHLFGFILIARRLLKPNEFSCLKKEIIELNKKYPFVDLKHYGFCDNWKDIL